MHRVSYFCTATSGIGARALVSMFAIAATVSACTNQQVYDTAQQNHALECQKYPDSRYEDCMRTVETDFETYQREREAAGEAPEPEQPR